MPVIISGLGREPIVITGSSEVVDRSVNDFDCGVMCRAAAPFSISSAGIIALGLAVMSVYKGAFGEPFGAALATSGGIVLMGVFRNVIVASNVQDFRERTWSWVAGISVLTGLFSLVAVFNHPHHHSI